MKRLLTNVAILTTIGLVGCSTNTQNENTGIGAVSGAVVGGLAGSAIGAGTGQAVAIGAGAIIGALAGGYIGHNMDSTDNAKTYTVMQKNDVNQKETWYNSSTHMKYTMTPTSGFFTVKGNPKCRHYHFTARKEVRHAKVHSYNGTACYREDGSWYQVR